MTETITINTTATDIAVNDFQSTLNSLQTTILVSTTTATQWLTQIHQHSPLSINDTNALLVENLPKVLDYHLYRLQIGTPLERIDPDVPNQGTVYYLPQIYSGYQSANQEPEFTVQFSLPFKRIYEDVIAKIIGHKFEVLLLGLQDLKNQLNINDVKETFNLISTLTEAGIAQLTDFAYAAKRRAIEDLNIYPEGPKPAANNNFKNIPDAIQQSFISSNSTLVMQIHAANHALEQTLLVQPIERIYTLEKLRSAAIAALPDIATILKRAAIILTQPTWSNLTAHDLKMVLLYGSPIPGYEEELEWARELLLTFSSAILDYLLTDRFLHTVLSLPKMPCFKRTECVDFKEQEINLLKLENHYDALANGQSVSALNFEVLSAPGHYSVQSEMNALGLTLGIAFTIGLGAYLARSYGRIAGFWGNVLGIRKDKEDPVDVVNNYHQVPTDNPPHHLKLRQV